jgi:hypothetical protein
MSKHTSFIKILDRFKKKNDSYSRNYLGWFFNNNNNNNNNNNCNKINSVSTTTQYMDMCESESHETHHSQYQLDTTCWHHHHFECK